MQKGTYVSGRYLKEVAEIADAHKFLNKDKFNRNISQQEIISNAALQEFYNNPKYSEAIKHITKKREP